MKRFWLAAVTGVLALALAGCSGSGVSEGGAGGDSGASAVVEVKDDAIKIDEIDWVVQEEVIDGNRCVGFSYVNNSKYAMVSFGIRFTQRDDVTDEQRSVFDSMYAADSDYIPPVEADELYVEAVNEHYAEPGEEVDPWRCDLSYSLTNLTMEQFELMRPDIAVIRYIGSDGNIYAEQYDFINDAYSLNKERTGEPVTPDTWPTSDLAQMMPVVESAAVVVQNDDEESFEVRAYGASEDDFTSYIDVCKESGFDTVVDENSMSCELSNADGYVVDITYYRAYDYFYSEVCSPEA